MYVESFDVISADFHCGEFVWVGHLNQFVSCACCIWCGMIASHDCIWACTRSNRVDLQLQGFQASIRGAASDFDLPNWHPHGPHSWGCVGCDVHHSLTKTGCMTFVRNDVGAQQRSPVAFGFRILLCCPCCGRRVKAGWVPDTHCLQQLRCVWARCTDGPESGLEDVQPRECVFYAGEVSFQPVSQVVAK